MTWHGVIFYREFFETVETFETGLVQESRKYSYGELV